MIKGLRPHWRITLGGAVLCLGAWQWVASAGPRPDHVLGPWQIALAWWHWLDSPKAWSALAASLQRALLGFLIGGGLGLLLGLWAGVSRVFRDLFDWTQAMTHPMPKIALFPVVAVVLGFTDVSRVLVIALSAFYPAYLNAVNGALGVNPRLFWVARNAGAGRLRMFWQVLLPASLPRALVGLRIALMVSFVLMVATEVVGTSNGLGSALMKSYREGEYGAMYAGILSVALCGMLANAALGWLGRRLVSWQAVQGAGHV